MHMRADRLLALIELLQARGTLTAADLAAELEVSLRTIYRDLTALSAAGVPVVTSRGPGGGVALIDEYRTTLTGLTASEAAALFMTGVPGLLGELGVSGELQAALRKLAAALPAASRPRALLSSERILIHEALGQPDGGGAGDTGRRASLAEVRRALLETRRLRLVWRSFFAVEVAAEVEPLGLAVGEGAWHLVCAMDGRRRVIPAAWILGAEVLEQEFDYPQDFDLAAFWQERGAELARRARAYSVAVLLDPALQPRLAAAIHPGVVASLGSPLPDGRLPAQLDFEDLVAARSALLGFGSAAEVLSPLALRRSIADFAAQVVKKYAEEG